MTEFYFTKTAQCLSPLQLQGDLIQTLAKFQDEALRVVQQLPRMQLSLHFCLGNRWGRHCLAKSSLRNYQVA